MDSIPVVLIAALATQTACQVFKVISGSIAEKRLKPRYFFKSGGMPSSHAAFVAALCVAVGIKSGIASDVFAVSAVFAVIVIHDAVRLRGTVEKQGQVIRTLASDRPDVDVDLPKTIGHNMSEIIVGILVGAACGSGVALVL